MAFVCSILLIQLSRIPDLCKADPGPPLLEDFHGAISPENSSQLGIEDRTAISAELAGILNTEIPQKSARALL